MKSKVLVGFLSLLIVTLVALEGRAQSQEEAYPTRPIEIIVPVAPGGIYDLFSRTLASFLGKKLGVPVNVVNKPGGNYIPGILSVYNAKPDGYTMMADGNSTSSLLSVAVKDLPFKIMDRTFISIVGMSPQIFLVPANSPFKSLGDAASEARRDPENFKWTAVGTGADISGFALRKFFRAIDVDISKTKLISVAGMGPGMVMVAGGNASLTVATLGGAASFLKAGTLRGLAFTSKDRHPDWPDMPTTAEAGYPSVTSVAWNAISGPPNLPAHIVAKWEKVMDEILNDPEIIAKLKNIGMKATYLDSKATREFVIKETDDAAALWGLMK